MVEVEMPQAPMVGLDQLEATHLAEVVKVAHRVLTVHLAVPLVPVAVAVAGLGPQVALVALVELVGEPWVVVVERQVVARVDTTVVVVVVAMVVVVVVPVVVPATEVVAAVAVAWCQLEQWLFYQM
jgi:hypothetical protein